MFGSAGDRFEENLHGRNLYQLLEIQNLKMQLLGIIWLLVPWKM